MNTYKHSLRLTTTIIILLLVFIVSCTPKIPDVPEGNSIVVDKDGECYQLYKTNDSVGVEVLREECIEGEHYERWDTLLKQG